MRIPRILAGICAIFLASCGGGDGEEDPSTGATTGGGSGSETTGTGATTGTGGGATGTGGGATTGTGGGATTGTGGGATTGTGGDATGTGGDATGTGGDATGTGGGATTGAGGGTPVESGLPVPPGAGDVPKPSGAAGGFKVIDWAGFTGAVSYSFDDSNSTQIQNYDKMNALGVRFTFYVQTGKREANDPVWKKALEDGHELGNHTKSHSSNDNGSDTDAATQFIQQTFGIDPYTMAAPNGAGVYTGIAKTRFLINRGVSNKVIAPNDNTDPFTLPTYIPPTGASASAMDQQINEARQQKGWRTFCIHGFTGGSDGAYQPIPLQAFLDHVENTKKLGDMWIDSMVNVGAYWLGQKAVSSGTSMKSGSDTTFTWQLPDHFPPGKYVRVTVTGGTLKQNGVPLAWDSRGYYEVALDPESVTLSP
ncbi:polysaccharide deacetylase [Sorangium cellulosum]|uniref:Polysaccharide deacetylase n=1 Tax=Sorangium cellulosum TaxID=56 RepID=A0A4P2Q4M4_SORCE|nr:polysaccharide deacetylase family protein [Sorangium cellulosum]AUX23958.1 polysaccharide deacetylase [Sorangium cellulosum]